MDRRRAKQRFKPLRFIVLGFVLIILIGTLLLMLPCATRDDESCGLITAAFTAVSATCVTGLSLQDTYTFWSGFGQTVIILLIQIGGLGFMTVATLFSLLLRRHVGIRERIIIGQSLSADGISGMIKLVKRVLAGTFIIEGCGALVLGLRFTRDFGFIRGMIKGAFHSVSAFCNAGFDLMGELTPGSSLGEYAGDFVVTITICSLVLLGGLGFLVWGDVIDKKPNHRFSLHTKIVLVSTAVLLICGTLGFFIFEYGNPDTIGDMNFSEKLLMSLFQSVTARTAGFTQMDQAALAPASQLLMYILMFIGGCPGSTAGGVKTTTVSVLLLAALSTFKGSSDINIGGKRIGEKSVRNSLAVVMTGISAVMIGSFVLVTADGVALNNALFEAISAFATVGLTQGITPDLSALSHITLMLLMFAGRVGVLTIGLAAMMNPDDRSTYKYPEGKVLIG